MTSSEIRNESGERIDHSFHPGNRADVLVILGHGVTGNKDRPLLVALAEGLAAEGWPCLRISFSGNGESEGNFEDCCITKETGDLRAIIDAVPADVKVAYAGHSMGGAVGVLTAAVDPRILTLISLAGMTHTADFVEREFGDVIPGAGFMWGDEACPLSTTYVEDLKSIGSTLSAAASISQSWLLIHGSADDVVPIQDGKDAFAAATCEVQWIEIPGAEHAFDGASFPEIIRAMDSWLRLHFG